MHQGSKVPVNKRHYSSASSIRRHPVEVILSGVLFFCLLVAFFPGPRGNLQNTYNLRNEVSFNL